jgi:o-succinylbenzoate synthase
VKQRCRDKDNRHVVFSINRLHLRNAMALIASFHKRTFHFGFDARTSRGAMKDKTSWFIKILDDAAPEIFGLGECGPLPGLSVEDIPKLEHVLDLAVGRIVHGQLTLPAISVSPVDSLRRLNTVLKAYFSDSFLHQHPAVTFALETALLDLGQGGTRTIFDNSFVKGKPIPINGLVWMGGLDFMLQQVEIKIRDGYRCIKLKVGGMDFEKECDILQYIRRKYFRENIVIRLDANGAFKLEDALPKLKQLSRFDVHSIEQPVKAGSAGLPELCEASPIPVALDEELIGVATRKEKEKLLERIRPSYIILKPSLHGGLFGCQEWIELAEVRNVGWWITSALESNIGLNAISQFAANYSIAIPQGLGTGEIYMDNVPSPLKVDKGLLSWDEAGKWDLPEFMPGGPVE